MMYQIIGLLLFCVTLINGMQIDAESRMHFLSHEIVEKWVYQRLIPLGLVTWAGYEYAKNGCVDERCRNAISPLILAGIWIGKQHISKFAYYYKNGNSKQCSPRIKRLSGGNVIG